MALALVQLVQAGMQGASQDFPSGADFRRKGKGSKAIGPIQSQLQQLVSSGNRYGSGARFATKSDNRRARSTTPSRCREKSRDQFLVDLETNFRAQPAGPQERADWLGALESTDNRLESMERLQRMQGQTIVHLEEQRQVL